MGDMEDINKQSHIARVLNNYCSKSFYIIEFDQMYAFSLLIGILFVFVACEESQEFKINKNSIDFKNVSTGMIVYQMNLDYYFSLETGGYTKNVYNGKVCEAYHPDQFFESCYLKKQEGEELIWYMTKHAIDPKYDKTKMTLCAHESDGICRYKDADGNTIYLADVIIVDAEIIEGDKTGSVFNLLRFFENSDDVLVLKTKEKIPEKYVGNPTISSRVYHLIDFNCPMLGLEMKVTLAMIVAYCIVLSIWFYRNFLHYPSTMTVLHRLMSIPPTVKFILMVVNYLLFYTCPWKTASLRIYIVLIKILLNLVFESILIGSFFLTSIGFKIARSNVSMKSFVIMLSAMLLNYLVIFILLVFNEFYSIGTILYTSINIALMVYMTLNSCNVIEKLQMFQRVARNNRYPEQAINIKLKIMKQSAMVIVAFFLFEILYHGVFSILGIPSSRTGDQVFFICHEVTDFVIMSAMLYILRTREYIPYYGIINLDNEYGMNEDVEMQHIREGEVLTFNILIDKDGDFEESSTHHDAIKPDDLAIIVNPEGSNPGQHSFSRMTFVNQQLSVFQKLNLGICQDLSGKRYEEEKDKDE